MTPPAGTLALIGVALRLDRVRLLAWASAITLVVVVTAAGFAELYPDPAARVQLAATVAVNPALLALYGPLHDTSIGALTVWRQGSIVLVLVALMNLMTVVRHTRAAEEDGRLELVLSTATASSAPFVAALAVAGIADLAIAAGVAIGLVAVGVDVAGSLAFGMAVGTTGLVFAGIAAVTAQLSTTGRGARGLAGAVLGASFVLRGVGDSAIDGPLATLTWISPLGLALHVRSFADERWWVLALLASLTGLLLVIAGVLARRRDLGEGVLTVRPGPARATRTLSSPIGLAWRLHRRALAWWAVGLATVAGMFGAVVDGVRQILDTTPQMAAIFERLGGSGVLVDAFLSAIAGIFAVVASLFGIGIALELRTEETTGRAELELSTPTSRLRWATGQFLLAALGPVVMLVAAGAAAGAASGLVTGQGFGLVGRMTAATVAYVPAVWVVVALAVILLGLWPRATALAYGALATFLLLGQLGPLLELDPALMNLSPFTHVPGLPLAPWSWPPLGMLTAVAALGFAAGLVGLRRRDLGTG